MNGRTLRTTAGLAGIAAAATAGALTVGLISGVAHTPSQAQGTANTNTNTNTNTGRTATTSTNSDDDSSSSGTSNVGSVSQNAQPAAGSHGS